MLNNLLKAAPANLAEQPTRRKSWRIRRRQERAAAGGRAVLQKYGSEHYHELAQRSAEAGRGRVKQPPEETLLAVNVRLHHGQVVELTEIARQEHMSQAAVIREAICRYLGEAPARIRRAGMWVLADVVQIDALLDDLRGLIR